MAHLSQAYSNRWVAPHIPPKTGSDWTTLLLLLSVAVAGLSWLWLSRKKADKYLTEDEQAELITPDSINAHKGHLIGKHKLLCEAKIAEAQRSYNETLKRLGNLMRDRQELQFKSQASSNVNQRASFQTQIQAMSVEIDALSGAKAVQSRAENALQSAYEALQAEQNDADRKGLTRFLILSSPSEEVFRKSMKVGGQHAIETIRKAGVSDHDRQVICDFLRNRPEDVE